MNQILPRVTDLVKDSNQHVKSALASVIIEDTQVTKVLFNPLFTWNNVVRDDNPQAQVEVNSNTKFTAPFVPCPLDRLKSGFRTDGPR